MRSWSTRAVAVLGTSALVMTAFAGAAAAAEPEAAPAQSHAEAQFLSGSLFNLIPFDYLLSLRGASATNIGQSSPVVQRNNQLVTLFGFPLVNQPNGAPISPADALQGGYAGQYAQASPGGSSRAASGALSDSGIFGDSGSTAFPSDATINLSAMQGPGAFSGLQDATLKLSTISSEAALTAGSVPATSCTDKANPTNCLDYSAAAGTLNFTSPQLADLGASVATALAPIDAQTAQLQSAITSVVKGLNTGNSALNTLLSTLGGGSNLTVNVNLALTQAVQNAVKAPISSGGVTLDPSTGTVTIDIGSFVKLNNRAPNTTLIDGEQLFDISPAISGLTAAVNKRITDAANTALAAASVSIHYDVTVPGLLPSLSTSLSIDLNASLQSVANGTAGATITAKALGVQLPISTGQLLNPLKALTAPVLSTLNTTVAQLASQISTGVGATLQNQVKPATLSIPGLLTMKVNVQSQPAPGVYQVTALQIGVGPVATINLATSRVGANTGGAVAPSTGAGSSNGAGSGVPSAPSPNNAQVRSAAVAASATSPATAPTADIPAATAPAVDAPTPPATTSADIVAAANAGELTPSDSQPQWLVLTLLLVTLSLACAGLARRRR